MKIAFLGDVALVGQFDAQRNRDTDKYIAYLKAELKEFDYVVANLESPLTDRRHTFVCKSMHLKSSVCNVRTIKELGINAVTLANNHVYDFGRAGLTDTIHALDKAGIAWYGVDGKTVDLEIKGERITLSGFCCLSTNGAGYRHGKKKKGVNLLTRNNIEDQLLRDKQRDSFSVLSVHWGIEHTNYPAYEHIALINQMAKIKPIVLHGHHPHQIQGLVSEQGSLLAYSMGNALFDKTESINKEFHVELNEENRKSFILGVEIVDGKIRSYSTKGFYIGNSGIEPFDIDTELQDISIPLGAIEDEKKYQDMRNKQYRQALVEKFGKHDLKWLKSRMNYYSIGAKMASYAHKYAYQREALQFYPDKK